MLPYCDVMLHRLVDERSRERIVSDVSSAVRIASQPETPRSLPLRLRSASAGK